MLERLGSPKEAIKIEDILQQTSGQVFHSNQPGQTSVEKPRFCGNLRFLARPMSGGLDSSLSLFRHQLLQAFRLLSQPFRVLGGTVEYGSGLEWLEIAARRRLGGFRQQEIGRAHV